MYKVTFILALLLCFNISNCQSKGYAPGFDFDLFKGTPNYALAKAVEQEDTVTIKNQIVNGRVPIDLKDAKFGNTLLWLAVADEKYLSTAMLLKLGANPNARSIDDSSPFLTVCLFGLDLVHPDSMLRMLIRYGADVNGWRIDTTNDQFGRKKNFKATPLRLACAYGNLSMVMILVENGAKLDMYGANEHSILSTAVLSGNIDVVKYLMIDKHAPIPDFVVVRQPGNAHEKKMTITDLFMEDSRNDNMEVKRQKREVLDYLKSKGKE